jgi:hypothetical protein
LGRADRKPEREPAAHDPAGIVEVLGVDPALVRLDDGAAQVQADAHAFALGREEGLVQALDGLGRQAGPASVTQNCTAATPSISLRHAQVDHALVQRHLGAVDGVAGVLHQVHQHLLDQDRVDEHGGSEGATWCARRTLRRRSSSSASSTTCSTMGATSGHWRRGSLRLTKLRMRCMTWPARWAWRAVLSSAPSSSSG